MYINKFLDGIQLLGTVPTTGTALISSSGQMPYSWLFLTPGGVSRMFFKVTTAFSSSANVNLQFVLQPTVNSSSASVVLGQLIIPSTAVNNSIIYKDINPSLASTGVGAGAGPSGGGLIIPGQQLIVQWTNVASTAGAGVVEFEGEYSPENPANYANMIKSA